MKPDIVCVAGVAFLALIVAVSALRRVRRLEVARKKEKEHRLHQMLEHEAVKHALIKMEEGFSARMRASLDAESPTECSAQSKDTQH